MSKKSKEKELRLLTLGNSMVGKSSLILRYSENKFYDTYISTIGVDYMRKKVIINKQTVNLQLWDSAGQEKYKAISKQYFRKANGISLVFDVSSRVSFDAISQWYADIKKEVDNAIPIVLIGNKIDVVEREISYEEAIEFANTKELPYFETSALNGINVNEAFEKLAELSWNNEHRFKGKVNGKSVTLTRERKTKNCCSNE